MSLFRDNAHEGGGGALSAYLLYLLPYVPLLGIAGWLTYVRHLHPLSGIPGPFLASITRLWYVAKVREGAFHKVNEQLHATYGITMLCNPAKLPHTHDREGPLVRISPNEVSIIDADAVIAIYGSKSRFSKTDFYSVFTPKIFDTKHCDLFTDLDRVHHATRRRLLNNLYSMTSILESEPYIDVCTGLFMERLSKFTETAEEIDFGLWLRMYAFDIVGELFFGRAFGFLESGSDHGRWIQTLDQLLPVLATIAVLPAIYRPFYMIAGLMYRSIRQSLRDFDGVGKLAKLEVQKSQDIFSNSTDGRSRHDILGKLLELSSQRGEQDDFKIADVQQEAYVSIVAGSDTVAISMCAILYQLLTHPQALAQLTSELDEAYANGTITLPVKYSDALKLPYFSACVKEGTRLHPSLGLPLSRHPPPEGCVLAGRYFPQSVRVGINAAVLHLDPSIFGADAAAFRPERWLEKDASNMERYLLTFGGGARTCMGKGIGLSEMYKMLPHLLLKFKPELVRPDEPLKTIDCWFHKQEGFNVRIARR